MFARKSTPESRLAARDSAEKWGQRELAARALVKDPSVVAAATIAAAVVAVGWVEKLQL